MEKSTVKNFILILLLLVNSFLLIIVISEAREERNIARYRRETLESVLRHNGIELAPGVELPEAVPPQLILKRDPEAEERLISSLIGRSQRIDRGGNIYYYEGKNGMAQFRGTGEFQILLNIDSSNALRDSEAIAKAAIKSLGLDTVGSPAVSGENGRTLTYLISYNGAPVRNAQLSFDFITDYHVTIHGTRPLDVKEAAQSSESYPDAVAVLMSFLESVHEKGIICSEINQLEVEYYMYPTVSGSCTLRPIWHIGTDSGAYYFDAETMRAEQFESSP